MPESLTAHGSEDDRQMRLVACAAVVMAVVGMAVLTSNMGNVDRLVVLGLAPGAALWALASRRRVRRPAWLAALVWGLAWCAAAVPSVDVDEAIHPLLVVGVLLGVSGMVLLGSALRARPSISS